MPEQLLGADKVKTFSLDSNRLNFGNKKVLLYIGIPALIVLVVVVIIVFSNKPKAFNQTTFNKSVSSYMSSGNYNGLLKYIDSQPKNKETYTEMVIAYTAQKNYAAALNIYKTIIEKYGNNANLAAGAASIAQVNHQNTLAIMYYKEALQYEKASSPYPTQQADENYYSTEIKSLEIHTK